MYTSKTSNIFIYNRLMLEVSFQCLLPTGSTESGLLIGDYELDKHANYVDELPAIFGDDQEPRREKH